MQTTDYQKLLEELRNHKIDHLDVDPQNFMAFYRALADFAGRKKVVGKAHLNGKVTYTFQSDE